MADMVNHPKHYTSHPSGVEVIQLTEHMNFCLGNAIKYIMRSELKGKRVEDLKKAIWYIQREIDRIEKFEGITAKIADNEPIVPRKYIKNIKRVHDSIANLDAADNVPLEYLIHKKEHTIDDSYRKDCSYCRGAY